MGLILNQIFKFIKMLNSETGTVQIAAGIAAGFILGMTPALSLQTLLVFLLIFFFRIQFGAAMVSAFFFKFIAFLFDPLFDSVGRNVLHNPSLKPLFTQLYNMPIVPYTRFNNTIVMGSGLVAIVFSPFIFFLSKMLVEKYRETVVARFKDTKFWKVIKATSLYKWYFKYEKLKG